jgi:hypothetical protein
MVVSPEALGAFFAKQSICPGVIFTLQHFHLQHLGLNDNHCKVMAHELARDDALLRPIKFDLTGNRSIGQHGYAALHGLLNRRFVIGAIDVDDQNWKTTFDVLVFMNREYNRGRFLKNGRARQH